MKLMLRTFAVLLSSMVVAAFVPSHAASHVRAGGTPAIRSIIIAGAGPLAAPSVLPISRIASGYPAAVVPLPQAAAAPIAARAELEVVGAKLAVAANRGSDTSGTLDHVFTGAPEGGAVAGNAEVAIPTPAAVTPTTLNRKTRVKAPKINVVAAPVVDPKSGVAKLRRTLILGLGGLIGVGAAMVGGSFFLDGEGMKSFLYGGLILIGFSLFTGVSGLLGGYVLRKIDVEK